MVEMPLLRSRTSWLLFSTLLLVSVTILGFLPQGSASAATGTTAHPAQVAPFANSKTSLVCSPTWIPRKLSAFRNPDTLQVAPPGNCSRSFRWSPSIYQATNGNTDPNADATAKWVANLGPSPSCTIQAFIPYPDAGADAQYYIWNGSSYKANTVINQNNFTGWVTIFSGGFSSDPSVTLDNASPNPNKVGWDVAAYAVQFVCAV